MTATATRRVDARITGDVSGQVAIGDHIVQNNVAHGGVIYQAAPGQVPKPRSRPLPVMLRSRRSPALLGRDAEIAAAVASLEGAAPAEFYAQAGMGKSALIRYLCHQPPPGTASHGVVFHDAYGEPVEDTLQFIYEAFYECDVPFKPTGAQIRHGLAGIAALIVLDDLAVGRAGLDKLLNALPAATFLVASPRRALWGDGEARSLEGLPVDAAAELLERELGRDLDAGEKAAARAIAVAVDGVPLRLLEVAGLVTELGHELSQLVTRLAAGSAPDQLVDMVMEELDDDQTAVLSVLTALGGASLPTEHLAELTGVDDVEPVLESLLRLRLLKAHSPRYSVTDAPTFTRHADVAGWDARLRSHFSAWAARPGDPHRVVAERAAIMATLSQAADARAWGDLVRLGRSVEEPFILTGRWGAWKETLDHELTGSRRLGERGAEAWALHQLGTRAACLEGADAGRDQLTEALGIRESIGDDVGVAATRHNLGVLGALRPPVAALPGAALPGAVLPGATTAVVVGGIGIPLLGVILGVVAMLAVVVGGVAIGIRSFGDDGSTSVASGPLRLSPARVDFGERPAGSAGPPVAVTVTNGAGAPDQVIDGVTLTGGSDAYRIVGDSCTAAPIAPDGSCSVEVTFGPPEAGSFEANLEFRPRDGGPLRTALSGTGTGVSVVPPSGVGLEPASIDFGRQPVNGPALVDSVEVVNRGRADVRVEAASISGSALGDYGVTADGCAGQLLRPESRCRIQLRFVPVARDLRSASLTVASSAGPLRTALSGIGEGGATSCAPSLRAIPPQTVAYGSIVRVPVGGTVGDPSCRALITGSDLPGGLALEDNGNATAVLTGVVRVPAGDYSSEVTLSSEGDSSSRTFSLTVAPADAAVTWLQTLAELSPLKPAFARALVSQTSGTQGDLGQAGVWLDLIGSGGSVTLGPFPVGTDGQVTMEVLPGQAPLGVYTALARLDPNGFFRMVTPGPTALVLNTDLLGVTVYGVAP